MRYDVRGEKGLKPHGVFQVFDANGMQILYPVYCDTDTGEVERIIAVKVNAKERPATVIEYHPAPLKMRRIFLKR